MWEDSRINKKERSRGDWVTVEEQQFDKRRFLGEGVVWRGRRRAVQTKFSNPQLNHKAVSKAPGLVLWLFLQQSVYYNNLFIQSAISTFIFVSLQCRVSLFLVLLLCSLLEKIHVTNCPRFGPDSGRGKITQIKKTHEPTDVLRDKTGQMCIQRSVDKITVEVQSL